MATIEHVVERFAPLTGETPSSLRRRFRAQQLAGQLPTGGRGGGKSAAHLAPQHFVAALLGLAAPIQTEAPHAAALFGMASFRSGLILASLSRAEMPRLHAQLEQSVTDIAAAIRRGCPPDHPCVEEACPESLWLYSKTGRADLLPKSRADRYYRNDVWPTLEREYPSMQRVTILRASLFMAAGEFIAASDYPLPAAACSAPSPAPELKWVEAEPLEPVP